REEDVERGDEVVVARCGLVDALALLLEQDRVAPVAERDLLVRRRRDRLSEADQVRDRRRSGGAGRAGRSSARMRLARHRRGDQLALEEGQGGDLRGGACV